MAFSTGGGSLKVTTACTHHAHTMRTPCTHDTTPCIYHAHHAPCMHHACPLHITRKVAINDKSVGAISSKPLCEAFANIYKDKNAVCTMTPVGADGEVSAAANSGLACALKGAVLGAAAGFGYSKVAA
eukprot:scaffold23491_cov66-Phaeocystis_antarctica.AAC.9